MAPTTNFSEVRPEPEEAGVHTSARRFLVQKLLAPPECSGSEQCLTLHEFSRISAELKRLMKWSSGFCSMCPRHTQTFGLRVVAEQGTRLQAQWSIVQSVGIRKT